MAELDDLILQNLQQMHGDMTKGFDKLNGRLTVVEDRVDAHDAALNTVKGGLATVASAGAFLTFFHEKLDWILKLVGMGRG